MTITKHHGLLAAALGIAACRSGGMQERTTAEAASASAVGAGSGVPLAPNPVLSAAPEPEVEHSIVWGTGANRYAAESLLLEWRSQELKVLGKRLGQIMAAGRGIYRWKQTSGKGEGMRNCDEAWNPGPEPNRKNRFAVEVKGAKVERLDATEEVEIVGIATVEDVASFSNIVTLEASGPYLFYSESEDSTYCTAAHNTSIGWKHFAPAIIPRVRRARELTLVLWQPRRPPSVFEGSSAKHRGRKSMAHEFGRHAGVGWSSPTKRSSRKSRPSRRSSGR